MTHDATDEDQLLWALLEQLTAARRRGEAVDVAAAARAHPELVDELRTLWLAASAADELGREAPAAPALPAAFGRYQLLAELGRGGMGVVYRAHDPELGREVALKRVLHAGTASAIDRTRFRAEAEAAARLDHPAILPVFETGEVDGQLYFTMKLVSGESLEQRLRRGPLPPREAAALLVPVVRAVQHAHEHGVLHRDLKPSNLLIEQDGRPFVADFGLARRLDQDGSLTGPGLLGTPSYMAPEQASGSRSQLGTGTDVWGLGAVLYQAVTGRPPFLGQNPVDTVLQVLEQDPVPPRALSPWLDRDLELVILKCLQKPTELRYRTAAALAQDLEAFLRGEPVAARRGSLWEVFAHLLRPTLHAPVLERWGLLWLWHGVVLLAVCLLTFALQRTGHATLWTLLLLWGFGLSLWAAIFWLLRRRAGPVSFAERQLVHLWGNSMIVSTAVLMMEAFLGLPPLRLFPLVAVAGGGVFFQKAGLLSGEFYLYAALNWAAAIPMALWPEWALPLFGLVGLVSFGIPGWRHRRG